MITGILSVLGEGIKGFFGLKKSQGKVVEGALDVLKQANDVDSQAVAAAAQIITAEANNSSWLASNWRPLFMVFFGVLIGLRWFGYTPPNMSEIELLEIYGLFKLGLGGYIGSRGLEKIVTGLGIQGTLKKFIDKKLG
jgi:hypothetical protein